MAAEFIISLDCEGKWGMVDHPNDSKLITKLSLDNAYGYIFDVLAAHNIKATMAFTSLFTVSEETLRTYEPQLVELAGAGDSWYRGVAKMISDNDFDGWLGNSYFERCLSEGHDLSWHGFTHHQLSDHVSRDIVGFELESASNLYLKQGISPKSMIFPRNLVGHLALMKRYGFECYRRSQAEENILFNNKFLRVLSELNIFERCQSRRLIQSSSGPIGLPSGFFLNWPSGTRSMIPESITIRRWKHMLDNAVQQGGQVHMWFHPHNLITAPNMKNSFSTIINYVGSLIKKGDLRSCTMTESLVSIQRDI